MDQSLAQRVALALNPPPDGFYDDELSQHRYQIDNGLVRQMMTRAQVEHEHFRPVGSPYKGRPTEWGTYQMLPSV